MRGRTLLRDAIAIAVVLCALVPLRTMAQEWPTRPLTIVVPFAAGGAADGTARVVAIGLSEVLGQNVIVENFTGAGSTIGANRVAKGPADGYQILLGSTGTFAQSQFLYKRPTYDTLKDFAPVALISRQALVLAVRKDLPVNDLPTFIAYAKANQANMQFGSAGAGSGIHLACAVFNAAIGVHTTHVPYRGGAPALQDLIGGRIDYLCLTDLTSRAQIEGGTIKAIAVLGADRSPHLPDLASAREQGLADFDVGIWYALAAPKAVPAPIMRKLQAATVAAMELPIVQTQTQKMGADLVPANERSSEYLQKFLESEIATWGKTIKASGITLD
ncbi:MAG: tripartite tricarboxylate transporter substrate binding protein [Hyphomicrobiales bacterium]|nr:tripartite tricarboxylate transporter substrate binding protein [Hyphomicrobiales bacterium]MBV8826979.1 tripartite tricarboxylate transporter substrate binding protein [Hyphomicrobiales bacterium]MBV9428976.1 tripartite tricarboxylate transporter substrate binding protein [Bradyrhizobiaceae bacterium]